MNKEEELYTRLLTVNVPEIEARQIAQDAMNETQIADAMLWGFSQYGDKTPTSIVEIKSTMVLNNCTEFQAVTHIANLK